MSMATFGRGRPVYGNGSYAPNRGAVSAKGSIGYMKRESRKGGSNIKKPGTSQTRSGVAAAALQRQQKGRNLPATMRGPGRPIASKPKPKRPTPNSPVFGQDVPTGGQVTPTVPTVQINAAGQLELPYNQKFSEATLAALQQQNQELLGLQSEANEQQLDYASDKRDLGQQYQTLQRNTLNDNAARGTAFSSGYGMAVGNNATAYNNTLSDLEQSNANFQNNVVQRRAAIENSFNDMLRQNVLSYADDVAQDAGNLGYGVTGPNTAKPKKKNAGGKYPVKPGSRKPRRPAKGKASNKPKRKTVPKRPVRGK